MKFEKKYLSSEQRAGLPTSLDIQFYEQHGWWISAPVLDLRLIEEAIYGIQRFHGGERDYDLPVKLVGEGVDLSSGKVRQDDYISLQLVEFENLVKIPVISAMAARLSRSSSIRLFHDQVVFKPGYDSMYSQTVVGWHTDRAYWQTCTSDRMLTAWIPLTECNEENGTLMVIDQSHLWPGNEDLHLFHEPSLVETEIKIKSTDKDFEIIPFKVTPGQICFHNCLTIHGSNHNFTDQPRIAFSVHLQDETNRYRKSMKKNGKLAVHINDILCKKDLNGLPDYSDIEICPQLWPPL